MDPKDDRDEEHIINLPSIEERLGALRPSRQLLEFYRRKTDELEGEHDKLFTKIDDYSKNCENEAKLERTIRQRDKEISDLQKSLSDLQIFLLQEREQSVRLLAENDKLRIRELEDRKTMQHLLNIAGPNVAECSYFHKEPPNVVLIPEHNKKEKYPKTALEPRPTPVPVSRNASKPQTGLSDTKEAQNFENFRVENKKSKSGPSIERLKDDKQILGMQLEALRAQLEESVKLSRDQMSQLMEDRRLMNEEHETYKSRETEKYEMLENRLRKTQELLRDTTKDFLQERKAQRGKEREWLQDRDKLMHKLDRAHDKIHSDIEIKNPIAHQNLLKPPLVNTKHNIYENISSKPEIDPQVMKKLKYENSTLKERLEQAVHLADMYREQCITAEEEVSRIRDEVFNNKSMFQERTGKLVDKLELTTKRYASLEKRRALEIEGYNTEIRKLKERCDHLESQLFKVSVGGVDDIEVLQNFKESAARSRALQSQIKSIKKKLYEVESNFRTKH